MLWPLPLARVGRTCESSVNSGRGGGTVFLALSSLKGLLAVPSTGSGAGTASSATPSQSSKGSLASPCSRPRGPASRSPREHHPQLAQPNFFISRAARTSRLVSASSATTCHASLATVCDVRGPASGYSCVSCVLASNQITQLTPAHDSPASSNQWYRQCRQECCTCPNTRDGKALAWPS